jgi:serine/threonine protein kinase
LQDNVIPTLVYAGPMIGGRYAIATSDCGQTLDVWAENASVEDKAMVGAEVRAKLRLLHEAGVLHRDIKAQNIAVSKDNAVRLFDLALSTDLEDVDSALAVAEREALDAELRYVGV